MRILTLTMKAYELINVLLVCLATALLLLSTVDLLLYNVVGEGFYTYESNYFK